MLAALMVRLHHDIDELTRNDDHFTDGGRTDELLCMRIGEPQNKTGHCFYMVKFATRAKAFHQVDDWFETMLIHKK